MALTRPRAYQIYDIDYKQAVRVVTTTDITLGGAPNTVDGISLSANDRILVTGQNIGSLNGIYYVSEVGTGSNGVWERSVDTNNTGELLSGTIVMVTEGNVFKDTQWKLTTDNPIVIGSTALTFVQNYSANSISAGTSNVVVTSNGAVTISSAGTANVLTVNEGSISVAGNIYPTANVTYGLGNTTNRFKDIWLSNSTIYLGNVALSANSTSLLVNGTTVVTETSGAISVTGNVTGNNILTNGVVSATGNIIGDYIIGNGSQLTGLPEQYGNSNVAAYLASGSDSSNIITTGNISGTYILGNGSQLTGLPEQYGNSNVAAYLASGSNSSNIITTGNVSGTYILGNVAFATGIPATYSNSNVSSYLASGADTSNIITTGNISGTYILGNGSQLSGINPTINANTLAGNTLSSNVVYSSLTSVGTLTSLSVSGNVTANNLSVTNQITGTNINATGTLSGVNGYFTGNIDVLGNINSTNAIVYGNSATFLGDPVTGNNAAYFGVSGYTYLGSNIVIQVTGNTNSYSQINFQNINPGTDASTDIVLTADNGNDVANYFDFGLASSNYALAGYGAYYPNDGYLLIDGGNLLLNIEDSAKALRVVVGSYDETELKLVVDSDGASITGNLAVSKNINVTGNLTVQGNLQYVNVEDLQIQDPVILIGGGANGDPLTVNDNQDRGSFLAYYTTGRGNAFVGWKNTTGNMIIASDVEFSANNIIQVNNYGTLQTGKIYNGTANADLGNVNTTRVNSVSGYFSGNVDIVGNLNATVGLVYANSGIFFGDAVTGNGAAYAGVPGFTPLGSNVIMQFGGNVNSYSQINFQNINSGTEASTDYILTADNGNDSSNYIDLGIGSSNYAAASFPAYGPNDGYLLLSGGNLLLNSANTGSEIKFLVGGSDTTDVIATISNTQLGVTGNISATGNIAGNYFIGNGSLLTGITGGGGGTISYSNTAPVSASAGDVWIQANTAIQYVYFNDGTSNQWAEMEAYQSFGAGGTGTPSGSNTQIQFNDAGSFGASANLTFDKSTNTLNATTVTANGAPLATTGKAIAMAIVFGF